MAEPLKRTIYTRDDYIDGKIMEQLLDDLVDLHVEYRDRQDAIDDIGQAVLQEMELERDSTSLVLEFDALSKFLNGEKSLMSSYENPDGGNRLMVRGSVGRWDGIAHGFEFADGLEELFVGADRPLNDCNIDGIWDENGSLFITGVHHDGRATVEVRQLTDEGMEAVEEWEDAWSGDTYTIAGREFSCPDDDLDALPYIWDSGLAAKPRYMELAFGCPAEEWEQPEQEQEQGRDAVQGERGGAVEKAVADKDEIEEDR